MLLSIIIPMYNGTSYIGRCLDSIYDSDCDTNNFEIICVDDFAPDIRQNEIVESYCEKYDNISLIRHSSNKRQGGARNTGISHAKGNFIAFIDQDDTFTDGGISKILKAIEHNHSLDIIMVTAASITKTGITTSLGYENKNCTDIMIGAEFIRTQEIPWCPWCYVYNRSFIRKHNLKFVENVRFEDMDWVMKATILADRVKFIPIDLIRYHISEEQTSFFGNDFRRIRDWLYMTDRVRQVALNHPLNKGSNAILNHYRFSYNSFLKRYLWRLKFTEIKTLLAAYPPYTPNSILMQLAKSPTFFATLCKLCSPILTTLWLLKKHIKH